jgi:rhodanese-related sulfurtransferase
MKLLESLVSMTFMVAAFAASVSYAADENAVPDISLADLAKAITNKTVTLIDCNGSKSYACGHIPGAINFADHTDDLAKVLPTDKAALVVAYCGGPLCGAYKAGSDAATKAGYTNVKRFSAGISGWKASGAETEAATLCKKCGQIKGSPCCCKEGQPTCDKCGKAKGSPGCCCVLPKPLQPKCEQPAPVQPK